MSETATVAGNPAAFDLEGATSEQLGDLLAGKPPEQVEGAVAPQAPTHATHPASETATQQPPAATEEDNEPEADGQLPKYRLRPTDHLEAEVFRLVKEGTPLREATEKVYGKPEAPKPEAVPQAPVDPFAAEEAKLKAELDDLNKQGEKADEAVDVRESRRIAIEIARKERALERIEDQRKQAQRESEARKQSEEQAKVQTAESADYEATLQRYPALSDKTSRDRLAFNGFVAQTSKDPAFAAIFESPNWRGIVADIAAARGVISPKAAAPATPAPSAPKPATPQVTPRPPNASKVLTSREATPPAQSFEISKEQVMKDIDSIDDPRVLDAMLKGLTTVPPRPAKR